MKHGCTQWKLVVTMTSKARKQASRTLLKQFIFLRLPLLLFPVFLSPKSLFFFLSSSVLWSLPKVDGRCQSDRHVSFLFAPVFPLSLVSLFLSPLFMWLGLHPCDSHLRRQRLRSGPRTTALIARILKEKKKKRTHLRRLDVLLRK